MMTESFLCRGGPICEAAVRSIASFIFSTDAATHVGRVFGQLREVRSGLRARTV